MERHFKLFDTHTEYTAFTRTEEYVLPNVSHCIAEGHVHYNPQNAEWDDPEFKRLALAAFNDGHEMTYEELAAITQQQWNSVVYTRNGSGRATASIFSSNTQIQTITDMEKFTGVHMLDNYTFSGCTAITGTLSIPSNITEVSNYVFNGCTGVTSIEVDHAVGFFGEEAEWGAQTFGQMTGVAGLVDLRNMTSFGEYHEFDRLGRSGSGLQVLMPSLRQPFGVWFASSKINAMAASEGDLVTGTIRIPEGYTRGGQLAFNDCSGVSRIICPESMTVFDNFSGGDESWNNVRYFEMGSGTTSLKGAVCGANGYSGGNTVVVCKAVTPPLMSVGGIGQRGNTNYNFPFMSTRVSALYVPDESVDLYKNSSTIAEQAVREYTYAANLDRDVEIGWKRFASVIRPLSEL